MYQRGSEVLIVSQWPAATERSESFKDAEDRWIWKVSKTGPANTTWLQYIWHLDIAVRGPLQMASSLTVGNFNALITNDSNEPVLFAQIIEQQSHTSHHRRARWRA